MKKYVSRGFTLVELMIVIAIIGILAAVLYPAMTGYFERSRDTNRQGGLRNLSLSLSAYQIDNAQYPTANDLTCVGESLTSLVGPYIQKLPTDPKKTFGVTNCATEAKGGYGYTLVKDSVGTASGAYVLAAKMEAKGNANFDGTKWQTNLKDAIVGQGDLAGVNSKGSFTGTAENAYYVVAQ